VTIHIEILDSVNVIMFCAQSTFERQRNRLHNKLKISRICRQQTKIFKSSNHLHWIEFISWSPCVYIMGRRIKTGSSQGVNAVKSSVCVVCSVVCMTLFHSLMLTAYSTIKNFDWESRALLQK